MLEKKKMAADAKKHSAITEPEEWAKNLAIAAKEGNIKAIKRLMKKKRDTGTSFDINEKLNINTLFGIKYDTSGTADEEKASALWIACKYGHLGAVDRLLRDKDIDVNSDLSDGTTGLCEQEY